MNSLPNSDSGPTALDHSGADQTTLRRSSRVNKGVPPSRCSSMLSDDRDDGDILEPQNWKEMERLLDVKNPRYIFLYLCRFNLNFGVH